MNTTTSLKLPCQLRTIVGKQNRIMRKNKLVPGVIYGEGEQSVNVTLAYREFTSIYQQAGGTSVVECELDGKTIPTLISEVTIHPVFDTVTHVDFRRVNLKKKVKAQVPVKIVGESTAIKHEAGVLLQQMDDIAVEAFPQNIPHEITVDISTITKIGQEIKISDLPQNENYSILDETGRVIVSVVAHKEESVEAQTERAETEITTAKPDVEEAEGAENAPQAGTPEPSTKDKTGK